MAVTLGAGSIVAVNAASSAPSSFVSVDPTRVLDTRTDVGLAGPFVSGVSQKLQVTGTVPTQPPGNAAPVTQEVVPSTATSAVFNVTVVRPQTKGFLSIRPGDASGSPATSSINFGPGGPNIANAVTVQLPASGTIDIYVNGTASEVLVDVAGYHLPATAGPAGPPGPKGDPGVDGVDGVSPAQVVWVAQSDGDFTSLSAALASITDASAAKPYVIKIAPGLYTEASAVELKDHVDVEGSGQGVTTLSCGCPTSTIPEGGFVNARNIRSEIRHLTINNTGGAGNYAVGVYTSGVIDGSFSMLHITTTGTGGSAVNFGVYNQASSPSMTHVTATGIGGIDSHGVSNESSSASMTHVTATGTGAFYNYGVSNFSSSPTMTDVIATATGGTNNYGVRNSSSSPTIRNSSITGGTNSILNDGTSPSAKVADTVLDGPVSGPGFACAGVYNAAFVGLSTSCT